jgi:H+/Cl- antiporter ClcA
LSTWKNSIIFFHFDLALLGLVILSGILFGLVALLFAMLSARVKKISHSLIKMRWMIPALGGIIIILLTFVIGNTDYLGLGVSNPNPHAVTILSCFRPGGATHFSWLWKMLFTVITLGTGFKGGEVTPLFFIGAALGNAIAWISGAPVDLMAGVGFIAVFAGATNTPVACTMMGVEIFGGEYLIYFAVACFTSYYFSGQSGIYTSQRISISKIK